jgi:hypothetical protein
MKRLVPNEVPITSNYEEITIWDEIIKISNEDTITGENLLTLKTNIEMKLGSKLQEYTGCPRTRGSNLQGVFLGDN